MKFPSLLRREEPAAPAADDDRTGTVATDTRPDERSDVEGRTEDGTDRRPPANDTVIAGRTATDPAASPTTSGQNEHTGHRSDAERTAEARAATARSTVHGSRSARAAATETVDRDRSVDDPNSTSLDRDRSVDDPNSTSLDRDRTIDDRQTTDLDRTVAGDRVVEADRGADRDRIAGTVERDGRVDDDRTPDGAAGRDVPPAPVGPRPRASLLATLGLIVGVGGVLFVFTGALAGYGIALGAVGAVLAVLGLMATRRRHIAGKSDALLGIAFGLGAVVLGVLAMTGQYDWPTTDGDQVIRLREWLDSQFVDRL
ncbi:thrombospondin [Verrucosispora sp. WMMD573]|uniref:thrombospondin n=1 Tax=Verrucosispora sp. WMMD573 TaxID=3015149 RepID=UPI00248BD7C6|nr:thrombospondin [Verrucosispora sp. WMMD573]WBB54873.1 thrombospondin [Verrucosispora sp. WMMD573]